MRRKRLLVGIDVFMIAASWSIGVLDRFAGGICRRSAAWRHVGVIGPVLAAISLGPVGRRAMSGRIGRNHRFDAAGNGSDGRLGAIAQ
jgi:hypothetical protein